MAEQVLPEGVRFFKPNDKAPDFVIGSICITLNDLVEFCKAHPDYLTEYNGKKQIMLKQLRSKQGAIYLAVDTYKKETIPTTAPSAHTTHDDDLPF